MDIRLPKKAILDYLEDNGVEFEYDDVETLTFGSGIFDRVIATCLFHHLENPELGLAEIRRVAKVGGLITLLVPHDPGFMYNRLRRFTSARKAKKKRILDLYELVYTFEHRNHYFGLLSIIKYIFKEDEIIQAKYPTSMSSYHFNAFTVFHIIKSDDDLF